MCMGRRILVLIIAAMTTTPGCGILSSIAIPRDFSNFETFTFELREGLGFCPPDDSVARASITRGEDGSYALELSVVKESMNGEFEIQPGPPRTLTESEVARMSDVFRHVLVHPLREGLCYFPISIDPCLTDHYQWDAFGVSGYFCAQPRIDEGSARVIQEFLESLRTESP